jgi:hypothetical protein
MVQIIRGFGHLDCNHAAIGLAACASAGMLAANANWMLVA